MKRTHAGMAVAALIVAALASGCAQRVSAKLKTINFDFDRYDIKADNQDEMKGNAAWLQKNSKAKVVVEGHCDERGANEYNIALGDRRAKSAKSYLQHLGVNGARISSISYGEERPVCTGHDEGCWWKNRRAEFVAK